jgi:hypothetical protein
VSYKYRAIIEHLAPRLVEDGMRAEQRTPDRSITLKRRPQLPNKCALLWEIRGECSGIPHLAKNERDVGHPAIVAGLEPKSAFLAPSTC